MDRSPKNISIMCVLGWCYVFNIGWTFFNWVFKIILTISIKHWIRNESRILCWNKCGLSPLCAIEILISIEIMFRGWRSDLIKRLSIFTLDAIHKLKVLITLLSIVIHLDGPFLMRIANILILSFIGENILFIALILAQPILNWNWMILKGTFKAFSSFSVWRKANE